MKQRLSGIQHSEKARSRRAFDLALTVSAEELEFDLRQVPIPWDDHLLNPRRLRGSDFLMRWSQGRWSEDHVIQAVNDTGRYYALPYGPSDTAPDDDIRKFELYFERLEEAGLRDMKRPDILVFRFDDHSRVDTVVQNIGGVGELPFTPEDDPRMQELLSLTIVAVECENSLWVARMMPDYGSALTEQKRLGGRLGLKKSAKVPTVIIKEEDRAPLLAWQSERRIPIHVWHVFYDMAFGISYDRIESLICNSQIEATVQVFQAPNGITTEKVIYKVYYQHAYELGQTTAEPSLVAASITDKNGHIMPYVRFEGGKLSISAPAIEVLDGLARE